MENDELLALFAARDEQAIRELQTAYGPLCIRTAEAVTGSREDAEECTNDALKVLWERIPPEQPSPVFAYLLRVVRNLALKKRRDARAAKRNAGETLELDAIEELISDPASETSPGEEALRDALNGFLGTLKQEDRILFLRRYWFEESISDLSASLGVREGSLRVRLHRLRERLRSYLEKEGMIL